MATNNANTLARKLAFPWIVGLFLSLGSHASAAPNIVMIIGDDQTYSDFGFMGHPLVQTPAIDRLAAASARFTHGYVPSSVCRPSLATLLTGRYPHQHGIYFNHPPPGNGKLNQLSSDAYYAARAETYRLIRGVPCLPRLLADAGYDCLQTGKFWEGHYGNAGFTNGMTTGRAAGVAGCWDKTLPDGQVVAHGNGDAGLTIGRATMQPLFDFIDAHQDATAAPFFIWYAPVLPHEPHNAPQAFVDLYRDDPRVPRHQVAYYAACSWFDSTVGRLVDYVEQKGLAASTLFLFVVDNGWSPDTRANAAGDFGVDGRSKRSPFEDGLRTPILIRWDQHVRPAGHTAPVSSIDIMPTLMSAAKLDTSVPALPGCDLLPTAQGRAELDPERTVFGEIYPGDASALDHPERDVAYRWIRQGPWKLIATHRRTGVRPWGGYLTADALYHVASDSGEERNRINEAGASNVAASLRRKLDTWWQP